MVAATEPTSPAAESYRSLLTSLQFARHERQLRTIVLTSPGVGEGKTATLANLGVVFAQAGERVVLVSCDLRRPRIGQFFGLDESEGLTSVLIGQRRLEESVLMVMDVATGEDVEGPIDRCRYTPVAWLPGGKSYYYTRRLAPESVPAGEAQYHRHEFPVADRNHLPQREVGRSATTAFDLG